MLDPSACSARGRVKHDPKPVIIRETDRSSSTQQRKGPRRPAGPGFDSQQPNTPAHAGRHGRRRLARGRRGIEEREGLTPSPAKSIENETLGLTPKRVTVSVGIPSSYFEKVWRERNPAKEGEEPKTPDQAELDTIRQEETTKIQKHVANLLRRSKARPTRPSWSPSPRSRTSSSRRSRAARHGRQRDRLAGAVLAHAGHDRRWRCSSLVMLRSMVRSRAAAARRARRRLTVVRSDETATTATESETAEEKPPPEPAAAVPGSGRSLRDELSEIVQEDPDAAANILRSWIGHVG